MHSWLTTRPSADKGIGSILTKAGHGQSNETTEKISDGVRSAFKKVSV